MGAGNYDPTDLRGQQEDKREAAAKQRAARKAEAGDIKWLMSSKQGRRLMWRMLRDARVFQLSFNTNAMQMAFNEGMRSVGNLLLDEVMTLCPDQFSVMEKEHRDDRDGNGDQSN
jgi:hypothetical protein